MQQPDALSVPQARDVNLDSRKDICDAIERCRDAIRVFQGHLNALVPVSKLPPEILADIFWQLVKDHWVFDRWMIRGYMLSTGPGYDRPYRWLRVTHVCRHWRNIALTTPSLWTRIALYNHECALTFLHRSKNAPITLCIRASIYDGKENRCQVTWMFKDAFEHVRRFKEIMIEWSEGVEESLIEAGPVKGLPLERITLHNDSRDSYTGLPTLPPFLGEDLPSLRILEAYNYPSTVITPLLRPTLTYLSLIQNQWRNEGLPCFTVLELALTLSSMPMLKYLKINGVLCDDQEPSTMPNPSDSMINLPNLHTLIVLSSSVDSINLLFLRLYLPQDVILVRLQLSVPSTREKQDMMFSSLSRLIQRRSSKWHSNPCYTTSLNMDDPFARAITVSLWDRRLPPYASDSLRPCTFGTGFPEPWFSMKLSDTENIEYDEQNAMEYLLSLLLPSTIRVLDMSHWPMIPESRTVMENRLPCSTQVKRLRIQGQTFPSVDTLYLQYPARFALGANLGLSDDSSEEFLFPKVKKLVVQSVRFLENSATKTGENQSSHHMLMLRYRGARTDWGSDEMASGEAFYAALLSRKHRGVPLEELVLSNVRGFSEDLQRQLESVVGKLWVEQTPEEPAPSWESMSDD